jgi:hypothetical protein
VPERSLGSKGTTARPGRRSGRLAGHAVVLALLLAGPPAVEGGSGLPEIASLQIGSYRVHVLNDSPGLRQGRNTLTVHLPDLAPDRRVTLEFQGPRGEVVPVVLGPLRVRGGAASAHGSAPAGAASEVGPGAATSPGAGSGHDHAAPAAGRGAAAAAEATHAESRHDHGAPGPPPPAAAAHAHAAGTQPAGAHAAHGATAPAPAPAAHRDHGATPGSSAAHDGHAGPGTPPVPGHDGHAAAGVAPRPAPPEAAAGHDDAAHGGGHGAPALAGYAVRGSVRLPGPGPWRAVLTVGDGQGPPVTGEFRAEATAGGAHPLYLGVTGLLAGGSILYGAVRRRAGRS